MCIFATDSLVLSGVPRTRRMAFLLFPDPVGLHIPLLGNRVPHPWPSVLSSATAALSFHRSFLAGQSSWGDLVPGAHPSSVPLRSTLAPRGLCSASLLLCRSIILPQSRCAGAHSSSVRLRSPFRSDWLLSVSVLAFGSRLRPNSVK
jgi:hypothetical protein